MLKKRFSPKLKLRTDMELKTDRFFTVIKFEHISNIIEEYLEQVKGIVNDKNTMVKLVIEALILFYSWNKDFLDVGLKGLPKIDDLDTNEERQLVEIVTDFIIESMHRVDSFHPEFRTLCTNVSSVSIIENYGVTVLLSISINDENVH